MAPSALPLSAAFVALAIATAWLFRARKSPYDYVPGPPSTSVMGYLPQLHDERSLERLHYDMCKKYGHVARLHGGFFGVRADLHCYEHR